MGPFSWYSDTVALVYRLVAGAKLRLYGLTSGYVGIQPPASPTSITYTLPTAAPNISGKVLSSTTLGVLSWITASGSSITWSELTAPTNQLAVNSGYIFNNSSLVAGTLPVLSTVGQTIQLIGKGAGGWLLSQNSGQTVHFGNKPTTQGVGGSIASSDTFDAITLICITANTDWLVTSSLGNLVVT